jgi:hypothetical protein
VSDTSDKTRLKQVAALLHEAKRVLAGLDYPNDDDTKNYEWLASEATDGIDVAIDSVIKATELAE